MQAVTEQYPQRDQKTRAQNHRGQSRRLQMKLQTFKLLRKNKSMGSLIVNKQYCERGNLTQRESGMTADQRGTDRILYGNARTHFSSGEHWRTVLSGASDNGPYMTGPSRKRSLKFHHSNHRSKWRTAIVLRLSSYHSVKSKVASIFYQTLTSGISKTLTLWKHFLSSKRHTCNDVGPATELVFFSLQCIMCKRDLRAGNPWPQLYLQWHHCYGKQWTGTRISGFQAKTVLPGSLSTSILEAPYGLVWVGHQPAEQIPSLTHLCS